MGGNPKIMPLKIEVATELVVRLIEGDERAFRAIYDQLHERIYRMLFALLKDAAQPEALLQETFVNLWLNRHKLNPAQSLYPYVYLVARRLATDQFRRKLSEAKAKTYLADRQDEYSYDTDDTINAADLQRFADEVIKGLPRQQQVVYLMSRNEGLSYDEIAERLHISRNTVKNHLVSALKTLKGHFINNKIIYLYFLFFLNH